MGGFGLRALQFSGIILLAALASSASAQPVLPLSIVNLSAPVPVGIASYGLYNVSNPSSVYQIQTNEIVGFARINSLSAYNATPPVNTSRYGATIQLNVVMNITTLNGRRDSYWLQDVIDMNTSNRTYTMGDNIWNFTTLIANISNTTVMGSGSVIPPSSTNPYSANFTPGIYAGGFNNTYNLTTPTYFIPIIKVGLQGGHPVVNIGYIYNGSAVFYDNVTFNVSATSAYLLVTPDYLTPVYNASAASPGNFYDAELVIGGEGSGEISYFSRANVTLWMGYYNQSDLVPFPSVVPFGADTAESSQNLTVISGNGGIVVTTGAPDYNKTLTLSAIPAMLSSMSRSSTKAPSTSVTSLPATSVPAATATSPTNGTPTSAPTAINASTTSMAPTTASQNPNSTLIEIAAVVVVALILTYLMLRMMRKSVRS